jgi:hypothetical protein
MLLQSSTGSSRPVGILWHVHQKCKFTEPLHGTAGLSLNLRASRQLSGKVLRYLKRVIVTPAVYWSFAPLDRSLRYQHWAGISHYTNPFEFAVTYVFIKQSESSSLCDLSLAGQAPLIPKLRGYFAEFPMESFASPRLSLLS